MSGRRAELAALHRLAFYRDQTRWKFCSEVQRQRERDKKKQEEPPAQPPPEPDPAQAHGALDETYRVRDSQKQGGRDSAPARGDRPEQVERDSAPARKNSVQQGGRDNLSGSYSPPPTARDSATSNNYNPPHDGLHSAPYCRDSAQQGGRDSALSGSYSPPPTARDSAPNNNYNPPQARLHSAPYCSDSRQHEGRESAPSRRYSPPPTARDSAPSNNYNPPHDGLHSAPYCRDSRQHEGREKAPSRSYSPPPTARDRAPPNNYNPPHDGLHSASYYSQQHEGRDNAPSRGYSPPPAARDSTPSNNYSSPQTELRSATYYSRQHEPGSALSRRHSPPPAGRYSPQYDAGDWAQSSASPSMLNTAFMDFNGDKNISPPPNSPTTPEWPPFGQDYNQNVFDKWQPYNQADINYNTVNTNYSVLDMNYNAVTDANYQVTNTNFQQELDPKNWMYTETKPWSGFDQPRVASWPGVQGFQLGVERDWSVQCDENRERCGEEWGLRGCECGGREEGIWEDIEDVEAQSAALQYEDLERAAVGCGQCGSCAEDAAFMRGAHCAPHSTEADISAADSTEWCVCAWEACVCACSGAACLCACSGAALGRRARRAARLLARISRERARRQSLSASSVGELPTRDVGLEGGAGAKGVADFLAGSHLSQRDLTALDSKIPPPFSTASLWGCGLWEGAGRGRGRLPRGSAGDGRPALRRL